MEFSLGEIWANMGVLARLVTAVLLVMSVASLGVAIERLIVFTRLRKRSRALAALLREPLETGRYDEVQTVCDLHRGVPLADLTKHGLAAAERARRTKKDAFQRSAQVTRALERYVEEQGAELRRGFSVLSSVGSVAPFVGLLGTVVGIINAFESIAKTGSGGLGSVSAGISEALVVTALGLAVAIPAVLAFNYLTTHADRLDLSLQSAANDLVEHVGEVAT